MSKGSLAREAAEEIGEALTKAAPKVRKTLGDMWGWKGGKKGEITGGDFVKRWKRIEDDVTNEYVSKLPADYDLEPDDVYFIDEDVEDARRALVDDTVEQFIDSSPRFKNFLAQKYGIYLEDDPFEYGLGSYGLTDVANLMKDFESLENAGVPRALTGRLLEASGRYSSNIANSGRLLDAPPPRFLRDSANIMKSLTAAQREIFLGLLPTWSGTLEDLAAAAMRV